MQVAKPDSPKGGKWCFPDGKGKQKCYAGDDYANLKSYADWWEEDHKSIIVSDEEYNAKPGRK